MNYTTLSIIWVKTEDALFPYESTFNSHTLMLRLNDFPEEPMYTLIVDNEDCESFDNWPSSWTR